MKEKEIGKERECRKGRGERGQKGEGTGKSGKEIRNRRVMGEKQGNGKERKQEIEEERGEQGENHIPSHTVTRL